MKQIAASSVMFHASTPTARNSFGKSYFPPFLRKESAKIIEISKVHAPRQQKPETLKNPEMGGDFGWSRLRLSSDLLNNERSEQKSVKATPTAKLTARL